MLFTKTDYSTVLPTLLSSHQVQEASEEIIKQVGAILPPLLESRPHYQALTLLLDKAVLANDQLTQSLKVRRFKDTKQLRGVGAVDGKSGADSMTQRKRQAYEFRKNLMQRFRNLTEIHLANSVQPEIAQNATVIGDILALRMKGFERKSYAESTAEFRYLFQDMDASPEVAAALTALNMTLQYEELKQAAEDFDGQHKAQMRRSAAIEEITPITQATEDARLAIKMLLTFMHFDIQNGDDALLETFSQIDEIIDRLRSVAKSRETRRVNNLKSKNRDQDQDQAATSDSDQGSNDAQAPVNDQVDNPASIPTG